MTCPLDLVKRSSTQALRFTFSRALGALGGAEKDKDKTKEQLINELVGMYQRIAELEASETERKRAEGE